MHTPYFAPPEEFARLRAAGDADVRTYPPGDLMLRVSGNDDPAVYLQVGVNAAVALVQEAQRYTVVTDLLDWGCGPGRVAQHIPDYFPGVNLSGCDPDAEAIAWAREHIAGDFTVSGLYPPLPYRDASFDAVTGLSVMTHLRRDCQLTWLTELNRVMRPGGVLLVTVHGKAAADAFGVRDVTGIADHYLDPFMAGILPADYYMTVLQARNYTYEAWDGKPLGIVDYRENAIGQHDLVVLRKP